MVESKQPAVSPPSPSAVPTQVKLHLARAGVPSPIALAEVIADLATRSEGLPLGSNDALSYPEYIDAALRRLMERSEFISTITSQRELHHWRKTQQDRIDTATAAYKRRMGFNPEGGK